MSSPAASQISYQATNLKDYGVNIDKNDFIKEYLKFFDKNSKLCSCGFSSIRSKWLKYAFALNEEIKVKTLRNTDIGIFEGIDEQGFLLLKKEDKTIKIAAGDVFV